MSEDMEAAPERSDDETIAACASILSEAGWGPHFGIGGYAKRAGDGWLVGGAPDPANPMHSHLKVTAKMPDSPETPDDPVEAARVLVAQFPRAPDGLDASSEEAQTPWHDESWYVGFAERPPSSAEHVSISGPDADDGLADFDAELSSADDGSERDTSDTDAIDAEFGELEPALEGADLSDFPELEGPDLGAEILETEREQAGGVAYFGDDIHIARLAKMGRLLEIATERKAALQEGWTTEEFASLQNHVIRIQDGSAPDDLHARERFDQISAYSRAMSAVDLTLVRREAELEGYAKLLRAESVEERDAGRDAIMAFNPEEGWA